MLFARTGALGLCRRYNKLKDTYEHLAASTQDVLIRLHLGLDELFFESALENSDRLRLNYEFNKFISVSALRNDAHFQPAPPQSMI